MMCLCVQSVWDSSVLHLSTWAYLDHNGGRMGNGVAYAARAGRLAHKAVPMVLLVGGVLLSTSAVVLLPKGCLSFCYEGQRWHLRYASNHVMAEWRTKHERVNNPWLALVLQLQASSSAVLPTP